MSKTQRSQIPHQPGVQNPVAAYDKVAAAYERGRPAYPTEAVQWLIDQTAMKPGARVLDLAAGTGKLTKLLLPSRADVIALEPVQAFRDRLLALGIETHAGTAEAIPLPDGSVDTVTVAAAFHWFDALRALAEIHRVLRPSGTLAILWNERDPSDATQRALTALIEPHRRDEPRQADEAWLAAFSAPRGFQRLRRRDFRNEHEFTPDTLIDRIASISFIATLPLPERDGLLEQVRDLGQARGDTFKLPHITHVYLTPRA